MCSSDLLVKRARVLGTEVSSKVKERAQDFLDEGRAQDSEWNRDRADRTGDRADDADDNNEFDFDDWEEESPRPQVSEPPIAQRYSKRSISVDDDRNTSDAPSNQNEPQPDRPLLNLSIPQPSKPDDTSRSFTAKPRPEIPDLRKKDPWDDDDWG